VPKLNAKKLPKIIYSSHTIINNDGNKQQDEFECSQKVTQFVMFPSAVRSKRSEIKNLLIAECQ
jgi:hypothetical protein